MSKRVFSCWTCLSPLRIAFVLSASAASGFPQTPSATNNHRLLYIGTYTGQKSEGIYSCQMDATTGALSKPGLAAKMKNPSFLAIHPNRHWLYAVGENSDASGKKGGMVLAYHIDDETGNLSPINEQSSGGAGPCHISVDRSGKCVLVANYGTGSIAAFPVGDDGRLRSAATVLEHTGSSVNRQRQTGPHPHQIISESASRFAFVPDLGTDQVMIYRLDAAKSLLTTNTPPFAALRPGAGPRHMAFHPNGRYAYLINELDSTITVFQFDPAHGALSAVQTNSTLPEGYSTRNSTAEIAVHPSGRYVYGSNRGHDSIAVFAVDEPTGRLRSVQHEPTQGRTPRFFCLDPSGQFLLAANQDSDSIVVFRVDEKTGNLRPTEHRIEVGAPVCIVFAGSN